MEGDAITEVSTLVENIDFLAAPQGWSCTFEFRPPCHAHRSSGFRLLEIHCNHAKAFKPSGTVRFHTSCKIGCKWRYLLLNVQDSSLAALPLGFYVKSYSDENHALRHDLVLSQMPLEFKESRMCHNNEIEPLETAESFKELDDIFWKDAAFLYSMGYTESQAFFKLRSQPKFVIVIDHLDLNPSNNLFCCHNISNIFFRKIVFKIAI